jgi:hypothetical protein
VSLCALCASVVNNTIQTVLDGAVTDYNDPRYQDEAKHELEALGDSDGAAPTARALTAPSEPTRPSRRPD